MNLKNGQNNKVKIPKNIKNIIFDMDDVLVLTRVIDKEVKEKLFSSLNLKWDQVKPINHLAMKELVPKLFDMFNIKKNPDEYIEKYFTEYNETLTDSIQKNQVPGVVDLINKLSQNNYNLSLVTSSTSKQASIICDGLGIKDKFDFLITADDITHSKPHPEPYQKAIDKLNASPQECLVFEDMPTGVMSAKAAGILNVVAITTTSQKEDLQQADFVIDSFDEIIV